MPRFVEKIRVGVRFQAAGGSPLSGVLSVAPQSAVHEGPETLLELLNSPQRVIPIAFEHDPGVLLLSRRQIEWVEPAIGVEQALVRPRPFLVTREERVTVEWSDGSEVEGHVPMELPREFNRASDYMNGDEDFFALIAGERTMLVNKSALRGVRIFTGSLRPSTTGIDAAA